MRLRAGSAFHAGPFDLPSPLPAPPVISAQGFGGRGRGGSGGRIRFPHRPAFPRKQVLAEAGAGIHPASYRAYRAPNS